MTDATNAPGGDEPRAQHAPEPAVDPAPTAPLEAAQPTQPMAAAAAASALPAAGQPAPQPAPVGPGPFAPSPPGVPPAGFGQPVPARRGVRGLWREATSTTGGRVATIVAGVFAVIVVVGAIALGASAIGRMGGDDQRMPASAQANRVPGGTQGRQGLGPGQGRQGFGDGQDGNGRLGQDGGLGLFPGLGMLGNVLHGELVTGGSSGTTIVYQVGTVTAYTKGSSLAVKSSDGFATTYKVDSNSHLVGRSSTGITVGDTVRVIATKDGPTVTTVQIVGGQGTGTGLSNGSGA